MADVWFAPYLPIKDETTFEPWRLIPFDQIARKHTTDRSVYDEVRRLRTAYRVKTVHRPLGAVVVPREGLIGEDVDRALITKTTNAIAGAALDGNAKPIIEDTEPNPHGAVSAENVLVVGHPLTGERVYALRTGAMLTKLESQRADPGRPLRKIPPPHDLREPLWFTFDGEYAAAVYKAISSGGERGERVTLAIEWLILAWSNAEAVTAKARVLSLRSGFDAILGGSDTEANRKKISKLLDRPDAKRTHRTWRDHHGRTKPAI